MRLRPSVLTSACLVALVACAPHDPRANAVLALRGDADHGAQLYAETCAACHRSATGWRLTLQFYGADGFVSTLIRGVPHSKMPSFASWTDQQLADVHAYVRTLR